MEIQLAAYSIALKLQLTVEGTADSEKTAGMLMWVDTPAIDMFVSNVLRRLGMLRLPPTSVARASIGISLIIPSTLAAPVSMVVCVPKVVVAVPATASLKSMT
jgi:type III secretory pathway component EscR